MSNGPPTFANGPPNFGNAPLNFANGIPLNSLPANGNANNQVAAIMNGTGPPNQTARPASGLRRALTERQINRRWNR
ncbi:hypothetical protein TWF718_000080 [Orbilia javanica]|uniref:Uncharacterized protein n=1 Tax=Orbilia javanica TaxID=47235 RepID=A0AAN8MTD3_9PEZI